MLADTPSLLDGVSMVLFGQAIASIERVCQALGLAGSAADAKGLKHSSRRLPTAMAARTRRQ